MVAVGPEVGRSVPFESTTDEIREDISYGDGVDTLSLAEIADTITSAVRAWVANRGLALLG